MPIDTLSHSIALCNKILRSLNINGLCTYDNLHKAYIFEQSNSLVNCSYILIFLQNSACYTINANTHHWNRINTNEIMDSHNISICNDKIVHMVQLPPAKPNEANAIETFANCIIPKQSTKH